MSIPMTMPLAFPASDNVNDSTVFGTVMNELRVPRTGAGRPRRRPDADIADKAYSSRAIRQVLRRRGIQAVIPERTDQKANRLRRGKAGGEGQGAVVAGPSCADAAVTRYLTTGRLPAKDFFCGVS